MYEHSFTGENWPSGGGFSVTKYTLDGLYEQHQLDRNWWTKSNFNLPLVRYLGCTITFYQSWEVDYICNYSLQYPMVATQMLYTSCQPNFMMMNKNCIFVPSKLTTKLRKGKKVVKFRPPHQMSNRWFFARDFTKVGLLMLTASAASFDHFYIRTDRLSNNCSFTSLNPQFFKMHDFINPPVNGYILSQTGTITKKLFSTREVITEQTNISNYTFEQLNLTYLGSSKVDQQGTPIKKNNIDNYFITPNNWGSPFSSENLITIHNLLVTTKSYDEIKQEVKKNGTNQKVSPGFFTFPTETPLTEHRYAPDQDTGIGNKIYLKSVGRDQTGWEPPHEEDLILEGFPLWAALYGFISWQVKLGTANNIYRAYCLVIESNYIRPQAPYYIPVDKDFIQGHSPYTTEHDTVRQLPDDKKNWYPSVKYQLQSIENIISTGPGIPKLGGRKSVEAKIKYNFYFKFGGCPAKMDSIKDPSKQETYPVPNYQPSTYSLQNPAIPQEYYLYQFDEQQGIITKRAAKRIKMQQKTETPLFSATGKMDPETFQEDSDTEEEDTTMLRLKLRKLKRERHHLEQQLEQLIQP